MKRIIGILLCGMLLLCCGCQNSQDEKGQNEGINQQEQLFEISSQLISILWDVDYKTFTSEQTTEFANQYYEQELLEDYLSDVEYHAGTEQVQDEKLVARVEEIQDLGVEDVEIDDLAAKLNTVKTTIYIENYEPDNLDLAFFEPDKSFTLIFYIYYIEQEEGYKIYQFQYEPYGENFLPNSEKQQLSLAQQQSLENICLTYLDVRYNLDYRQYNLEEIYSFYQTYCSQTFLDTDGITLEWLESFYQQVVDNQLNTHLVDWEIRVSDQKIQYRDMYDYEFYYYADMDYTYEINASEAYRQQTGLEQGSRVSVSERLYFDVESAEFKIVAAEFIEPEETSEELPEGA